MAIACNHRIVEKNYPRGTEYHIVAIDYDPDAMEEYDRTIMSFGSKEEADAWLADYFTVSNDIPF